jgi:hypothetical protein
VDIPHEMQIASSMVSKAMTIPQTAEKLMEAAKQVGYGQIPPYQHSECFTTGAFDLILSTPPRNGSAFELSQAVCAEYDSVKEDTNFLQGYIYLLNQLARASGTTELPDGMRSIIADNPTQTGEFQEWYRLKGDRSPTRNS